MSDAKRILVEYEDGTIRELDKGIAAEFDHENMSVDMLKVSGVDMVRIAYGMVVTIEKLGLKPLLLAYANGEPLPDER